jgi:hypothetical protein
VQHGSGRPPHPFGPHLAGGRAEQGEELGDADALVLVRLPGRMRLGLPALPRQWRRLGGPRLILAGDRYSRRLRSYVRLLDLPFFCSVSGSTTVTVPALRWRRAVPVGHHVRVRCQR